MSTSSSLFCEYCGAANETEAHACCFCGRPLDAGEITTANTLSSPLTTLPIDTLLKGRYRIIKAVGQGGMGTVYRAQDTALSNRAVAIKELIVYDPGSRAATEAIEGFKREATLLAGLQHANLPSVFEHFKDNERWYMAMTFIPGETLEDHLERTRSKKLPLREVLEIGKQLSSVLYYLHNQYPPIIFRDVKPANIMRAPDGQIYLIDFGVARRFKSGQKKDTIPFGSLGYAAPEQFGKSQTTPRSDIYALGATLYELLSGHEPASTPLKLPSLRTLEPSLPFKLVTLITQMLDHNANKRPANMLIVEQKLQEIDSTPWQAAAFPPTFSTTSTPSKGARKLSGRLVGLLCTLTALFCLIVGGAIGDVIGNANSANTSLTYASTVDAQMNTPTVQASQTDLSPPGETPALFDPLNQANQWSENTDTDWGGSCLFQNNGFQISLTKANRMFDCDENQTLTNFAFQVKLAISQGSCSGITFRESSDGANFYNFGICHDGFYFVEKYTSHKDAAELAKGIIGIPTNDPGNNLIAVVANGANFDLYVSKNKITSVADSSYTAGVVGLFAETDANPTTTLFQDAAVWTLS